MFDFVNTLKENKIGIVKETRYTKIPLHFHKDMELSYIYGGECTFLINGKKVKLTKGDICIIDTDVIHSAEYKGENDIVFNLVFRKSFFSSVFLTKFADKGVLGNFLLNAITNNQVNDNYLIFHTEKNKNFRKVFDLLLMEHYFPSLSSISIIEHYFSILFLELINLLNDFEGYQNLDCDQKDIFAILKYIEENSAICSLNDISEKMHFSTSYIYKLLKKKTGKTFSQLKLEQQMKEADFLLSNTELPVTEILEKIGIKNPTYFYRKFQTVYGYTPKQYRILQNSESM
ncbi:AraC family transcriptional regulator [Amphibacillus sp. Q70]|uniref:AraC family transcriptional regulator n=1 Tax=Amphibacillus sp. Q70 TaxID=3453416 RepID=UPI003F85DA0B